MHVLLFVLLSISVFAKESKVVPGEYVVKFKSTKSNFFGSSKRSALAKLGFEVKSEISEMGFTVVKSVGKATLASLKENPNVEIVEPNYIYTKDQFATTKPNDPDMGKLWGLINEGQADFQGQIGIAGVDINATRAWSIQTGSPDVIVAVIDSGINLKHKDYQSNLWVNQAEKNGKPGLDDDRNGYVDDVHGWDFVKNNGDVQDMDGHGSHCAGTISANGNDGVGIVGVTWNSKIMPLKFMGDDGEGTLEGAILAIDYAIKNGAKVINSSWGNPDYSQLLKEAIERTNQAGMVYVASAGNKNKNTDAEPHYPSSYSVPNIISVAAIDNIGQLANFSNFGRTAVDIGAPGVEIYSTVAKGYAYYSGTSMATPHVAGVAALVASQHPKMTGVEIKEAILNSAKPNRRLRNKVATNGQVDAYNALMLTNVGPDMNDPGNWKNIMPYSLSTDHPYKPNQKNTWEIRVPGASEIALYFEKFDSENRFDFLDIFDGTGKKVQVITGLYDDSFSEPIKGDTVRIVFDSDRSLEKFGFEITKIHYK